MKKTALVLIMIYCSVVSAQWIVQQSNFPAKKNVYRISAINENVAWACGMDNTGGGFSPCTWFCRTVDGGENWLSGQIPLPDNFFLCNISAIDESTAWVAAALWGQSEKAGIYKTSDGGKTWTLQTNGIPIPNTGPAFVHFFDANDGFALFDPENGYNSIFTSLDGGATWQRIPDSCNVPLLTGEYASINMYCTAGNTVIYGGCYGSSGRVFKSKDRGKTWSVSRTEFMSPASVHVWPAFKDSLNGLVAAGAGMDFYGIANTFDGGWTWNRTATEPQVSGIWAAYLPGTPAGYMLAGGGTWGNLVGKYPGTAFTLDQGASWTKIDDVARTTPAFVSRDIGWAGAQNSTVIYKWRIGQDATIGCYPVTIMKFNHTHAGMSSKPQNLSITNYGINPLIISDMFLSTLSFKICNSLALPITLNSLETVNINVCFTPITGEVTSDSIVVISNSISSHRYRILLQGEGIAIERVQPGTFYAAAAKNIYSIDPVTAKATLVSSVLVSKPVQSIVINPISQELIGTNTTTGMTELYSISATTGKTVLLQTLPVGNLRAFTFKTDTLYGATVSGQLYRINLASGETALIGSDPQLKYYGLATHPASGQLYASAASASGTNKDLLVTIDPTNGSTTIIGATGDNILMPSLSFSPSGTLYGLKYSTNSPIITIDLKTGAGTPVGSAGVASLQGLAWAPQVTAVAQHTSASTHPLDFALLQNYPNPFNSTTNIVFSIAHPGQVEVEVINLLGEQVARLHHGSAQTGKYKVIWSGNDANGCQAPSGVYIIRLSASGFSASRKMLLLR